MVTVQGVASVLDRTVFVNKGPMVKRPLPVLTGDDLRVVSWVEVEILSGSFGTQDVGKLLQVEGSPGGVNDGEFTVREVRTSKRLVLDGASFDITDEAATVALVVGLANSVREAYEGHRIQHVEDGDGVVVGVHVIDDLTNAVAAPLAFDFATAVALLNDVRTKYSAHVTDLDSHKFIEPDSLPSAGPASSLASAILLANDLRSRFESHRQNRFVHVVDDPVNSVTRGPVKPVTGTYPGPLTGPFTWTLKEPRYGTVADDPTDVSATVNSLGAPVDAVFGLLGAIVLRDKPGGPDSVLVDYDHMSNPPARLLRTNSSEFNTNQAGNRGFAGLPSHRYRSRSHIVDPGHSPDLMSAVVPKRVGWRYKGFERAYSALTNDPTTLLTNVPANRTSYPVLFETVPEITIRYDPFTLPQNAADPWTLNGEGSFSLAPGGTALTILDLNVQTGPESNPPFFHHELDLKSPSRISAAFRALALDDASLVLDGVFTGVSFGLSDGQRVCIVGFLLSEASNLSSAIVLANSLKAQFNAHLTNLGSHSPDDVSDAVAFVDAGNLAQLLVLANSLRSSYLAHVAKGSGPGLVHQAADGINVVASPAATSLETAISLLNELRTAFNAHGVQAGVHFVDDPLHSVPLVRQVGVLTDGGFPEFIASWEAFAADWTEYKTYRISRSPEGDVGVFLSGDTAAEAEVAHLDLPALSDVDGRFDPAQQVFFGPIGRDSTNTSRWQFVRVNSTPIDFNLIEDNKYVEYIPSAVPERDANAPWITVGQGGSELLGAGPVLVLDSSASAFAAEVPALGLTSGAYRGFLRLEPILTTRTTAVFEYRASVDYYTFGLDNRAASVVLDDGEFSVQLCFLQFSPSAPTVTGTTSEPFPMVNGDQVRFRIGDDPELVVTLSSTDTTASNVAAAVNTVAGFAFADVVSGKVRLTGGSLGSSSSFTIVSGSALAKIGISPGTYIGKDSNPEPRISWFGANFPDADVPAWTRGGGMQATMLGRTMRLTDSLDSDYVAFTLSDPLITSQPINALTDWKMGFRCRVLSFFPGNAVPATLPKLSLGPCGVIASVDEGPSGKGVELHIAQDGSGNPYLNLLSFNPGTGGLDVVAQYAFSWNDGQFHSYDVFTSKGANLVFVVADGVFLSPVLGPTPSYSGLNQGTASGPSISFGSGGEPVLGVDLRTAKSVVDWTSDNNFRDSKVSDPSAALRRYVGLYLGGDPSLLGSYALTAVDWTVPHTYRVVRNPTTSVSLYVDSSPTPRISQAFDVLSLPPQSASFLTGVTSGNACASFGCFSPSEISRMRWEFVRYSIGKLTTTDRIVPHHALTNRANLVASPDHLYTQSPHSHAGFSTYSGGTPLDGFMEDHDPGIKSYTTLGERTPPVPKTQNLENRFGLRKEGTLLESVPVQDAVNFRGEVTDLDADRTPVSADVLSGSDLLGRVVDGANTLKAVYNGHLTATDGVDPSHVVNDGVNVVSLADATDLPTAVGLLNDIVTKFNAHVQSGTYHPVPDTDDVVSLPPATDLLSAAAVVDALLTSYMLHRGSASVHVQDDTVNAVTDPDAADLVSAALLAESSGRVINAHLASSAFHDAPDVHNVVGRNLVSGIGLSNVVASNVVTPNMPLAVGDVVRFLEGPNVGLDRTVSLALGGGQFAVTPILPASTGPFRFAKVVSGNPSIDSGTVVAAANQLKAMFNRHRVQELGPAAPPIPDLPGFLSTSFVHPTNDPADLVSSPDAVTLADALVLLNDVKARYNAHRTRVVHHLVYGLDLASPSLYIPPQDEAAVAAANGIREAYLAHLTKPRVHLADDVANGGVPGPAADLASAIAVANSVKALFNVHREAVVDESQQVHTVDDTVNAIVSPDATDLSSLLDLLLESAERIGDHFLGQGYHSGTVYVRLDPPSRVLYASMKFYEFEEGEEGHVFPFSDDETLYFQGGFRFTSPQSFSYDGSALPEDERVQQVIRLANDLKLHYGAHRVAVGAHLVNDTVNVITAPDATDLPSALALLADFKAKYNAHSSSDVFHIAPDLEDQVLAPGADDAFMATSLANESRERFDAHKPNPGYHPVPDDDNLLSAPLVMPVANRGWQRVDDGGEATVSLETAGPDQFLRYGVADSRSVYRIATGIPDTPSLGVTMTVRLRINSFTYDPNVETSIYAGFLGAFGPGVAAAVGFDALSNIPYVKIQDVNADKALLRIPFDWSDGFFHTFSIVKDPGDGGIGIVVLE